MQTRSRPGPDPAKFIFVFHLKTLSCRHSSRASTILSGVLIRLESRPKVLRREEALTLIRLNQNRLTVVPLLSVQLLLLFQFL